MQNEVAAFTALVEGPCMRLLHLWEGRGREFMHSKITALQKPAPGLAGSRPKPSRPHPHAIQLHSLHSNHSRAVCSLEPQTTAQLKLSSIASAN